jgi:hypothetical protein
VKPTREEVERWWSHGNIRGSKGASLINAYYDLLDENERQAAVVEAAKWAASAYFKALTVKNNPELHTYMEELDKALARHEWR